ncbi:structural maintenance of chromosomes protein 3-like [Tigriopus californicus]|uniref:structural maintenance of chromosomes protein 3-like n=1 Tax=Tigriopus californicus TaxID=6832 RepID=UPI0027D9CF16|nr:structural maintenance of chromosomes protein 3-like [Tigriopus californicus]
MVHIRRTIGHKQDTIHVNKKLMKRGALLSLLESAGFSRRNPYYIVQQGGIQRMALCSNETRLALVKDLAGIADFESRKEEAIKKLRNWEMEKEEVDNRVEEIEKDFQKLKAEGQELKLFMKLEKQKQTLVKVLSLRRANDVDKKLEEIQPIKAALALKKMEAVQVLEVAQADLNEAQAYLQRSVKELEDKTCTRDVLREEIDDLIENEAKLNVQLSALKREIGEREHSERGSKEELQGLKEKLFAKENELKTKSRELKKATEECQWKELEIAKLRQAQKLHYSSKAWDSDNFRSDDERQDFIQHEMTVIDEDLHDKERELEGIAEVHDKLNQVQQKLEEEIRVTRRAIDEHQTWIDNLKASAAEKVEYMTSRQQLSDLKSKESDAMAQIQDTRKRLRDLLDLKEKNLTKAKLVSDKRQSLKAEERCLISRLDDLVRELETAAEAAHRQQMDRTQLESSKWMLQKSAFHLGQIDDDSGFETRSTEVLQIDMKLQELTSELQALFQVKNRIETERNQLKNDLDMNLKAKLDDLSTSLSQAQSSKDTRNEALICQSKWKLVCSRLKEAQESLKKVEHRLAKIGGIRFEIQDRVDQSKSTVSEAQGKVKALSEEFANLAAKEAKLKAVSEEEKDKIGKLAEDDVANEYAERDTKSLLQEFKKVQKEWEKYQNVNRQAIDDYLRLESEKKKFAKLLENSGQNHDRISHLLEDIEVHRKNKIHFTFNQISKYFSEIFNDLVVDGRGKMKFILRDNDPDEPLGIALKVRFCSSGDLVDLNHLSGGQKSIVAIAFIFAIQKCDPAPFYILDEADAALDSNHRHRVIQWMANQKMQFICTTFKPEFLSKADHCIGIRHSGVSSVAQIVSAQDAHNFVEQPEDDEEHPGDTPNMEH